MVWLLNSTKYGSRNMVGKSITTVVLKALNTSVFPNAINLTFIIVIPKKKVLEKVVDFGPISLCHVIYKLIKKCC